MVRKLRKAKAGAGSKGKEWPKKWKVDVLKVAKAEGKKLLTNCQYEHVVEILKRLKAFGDHESLSDLDIEPIDEFWELREKGGPLGKINLRVYFATLKDHGVLVVLKAYKKEEEGKTPQHIILLVKHRLKEYQQTVKGKGKR